MRKLLKFLKPYAGGVVAVICVLVVQAFCDLSLPTYTSDIVNVGIQQGGIDETVPETIAKEDLEKLLLFVPSKEQEIVMKAYTETTKSYGYDGIVMELKSSVQKNEEKMEQLSSVLGKPMFLVTGFDSDSDMTKQMKEQMQEQIDEKISDMPDSMIEQAAASYIRNAYEHIGMDVDEIEIRYILRTGGKMLALAALGMVASILVGLMASRIGAGVGRGLRRDVFRKVVGFSNGEFDKFSTASLITRSTNDIQQIQACRHDTQNGYVCTDHGNRRYLESISYECGHVLDHCTCSRNHREHRSSTVYCGYAEISDHAETGGPAESGKQRDSDRPSGYPCFWYTET